MCHICATQLTKRSFDYIFLKRMQYYFHHYVADNMWIEQKSENNNKKQQQKCTKEGKCFHNQENCILVLQVYFVNRLSSSKVKELTLNIIVLYKLFDQLDVKAREKKPIL